MNVRRIAQVSGAFAAAAVLASATLAQDLRQDLAKFVETPAVSGYEQDLAKEIRLRLAKFKPQIDTLGDVVVTIGSGTPNRVIATPMDEAGYIVSGVTPDGYIRVQRLPQTAPNPVFDTLHAAQPISVRTRAGKIVPGVVDGLSTHLQGGRINPPAANNLDDVYVDIGASSAADVRAAGVEVLDPLFIDRHLYEMAYGRMTAPAIGDRFGCAALAEMLLHTDVSKVKGTLTVAFLAQQQTGTRGIRRILTQHQSAQPIDEMIYVGRLLSRRAPAGGRGGGRGGRGQGGAAEAGAAPAQSGAQGGAEGQPAAPALQLIEPKLPDGSGVLIGTATTGTKLAGFAGEIAELAAQNHITAAEDYSAPLIPAPNPNTVQVNPIVLPQRFAHIGIATRYPITPGEVIDGDDLIALTRLLEAYASGSAVTEAATGEHIPGPIARPAMPATPKVAPASTEVIARLTEAYGVSRHEKDVHDTVQALLPSWAKTQTDDSGNIWLHIGSGTKDSKTQHIAVVAHMDEIGYDVCRVDDDGRLGLISRGGGTTYFFSGHAVLVHTPNGDRPGVIELPANWNQPDFKWPTAAAGAAAAAAGEGAAAGGEGGAGGEAETAAGGAARGGQGGGGRAARPCGAGTVWRVDVGARSAAEVAQLGITTSDWVTVPKKFHHLYGTRANNRSFDDRMGCAALIEAVWALGPQLPGRDVTFIWSTGEEIGLVGAGAAAKKMAADGHAPDFVFAIDTFVSSDSPIESKRFADAIVGKGFVVRAVDNSNITPREFSDRVVKIAAANNIPAQFGTTGGGNDGSMFVPFGSIDVGLGWPLRYSHSPGEVIDIRDLDALAHILEALSKSW